MSIDEAQPCDIVAFAAHPDDVELNCAGTLALAVKQGHRAGVVDFCRGELGTRGTPESRDQESAAAAEVLGLTCRVNLQLRDGHLRDDDESRALVVRALRRMRPTVVIAPPPANDHHADHVATGQTVSNSFYLAGVRKYVPGDEPWRPHALLHYCGSRLTAPTLVVDVSEVYDVRTQAALCYRSQFYQEGSTEPETRIAHPEFLEAIDARARHFGMSIGVKYGEAYIAPEPVPVRDLVELFGKTPWE